METLTWWERVQQAIQDGARMKVESEQGFPAQAASIAEVINPIPTTPEDVALTLAGGPVAKGIGGAAAGVLKYLPWDKAGSRLPDLAGVSDAVKKQYERLMKKSGQEGIEYGVTGVKTPTAVSSKTSKGTEDALEFNYPDAWYSHRRVAENPAVYQMHTHPGSVPFFSLADIVGVKNMKDYAPNKHGMYLPGQGVRGNTEHVVATPGKEFSWLTLPESVSPKTLYDPKLAGKDPADYEAAQDVLARLIYGAKKDRFDLQLGFDPRQYGVSK